MRPQAFTLIELLAVIVTFSILIAILLPALGRSRQQAQMLAYKNTAANLVQAVHLYAQDNADHHPYLGVRLNPPPSPHIPEHTIAINGWMFPLGASYFSQRYFWLSAICPDYYEAWRDPYADLNPNPGFIYDREDVPEFVLQSTFWMTDAAFADPRHFCNDDSRQEPAFLRATRTSETLYPSNKAILTLLYAAEIVQELHKSDQDIFAMGDGSAEIRPWHRGAHNQWTISNPGPFGGSDWHTMGTLDGIRGRDW